MSLILKPLTWRQWVFPYPTGVQESTRFSSPQMVWPSLQPSPLSLRKALTIKAFLPFGVCHKENTHLLVTSWLTSTSPRLPKLSPPDSIQCPESGLMSNEEDMQNRHRDHGRQLVAPLSCVLTSEACCHDPNRTRRQVLLSGATTKPSIDSSSSSSCCLCQSVCLCGPLRVHLAL